MINGTKISQKNGELCSKLFRNSVKDLLTNLKDPQESVENQLESINKALLRKINRIKMVNYKIKFPINRKKNFRKNPIKKMTN